MITHITSTMKLFGTDITQIYQFDDTNQRKMNLYQSYRENHTVRFYKNISIEVQLLRCIIFLWYLYEML